MNAARTLLILAAACRLAAEDHPTAPPRIFAELNVAAGADLGYRPGFRGGALRFVATGLPEGMTIDPATGLISGRSGIPGDYDVVVLARNQLGSAQVRVRIHVLGDASPRTAQAPAPADGGHAGAPPPPPPPPPAGGSEDEEDEVDPMLASGAPMHDWTDNQRRVIQHWFLPGAATLPEGDWYYRISHVARQGYDVDARTNLLGLDDSVRIGIMLAWSPVKATTVSLQRINGRDLAVASEPGKTVSYDTWEMLGKWQVMDQRGVRGSITGPCDLTLILGSSWMLRNHGSGDTSLDLGVIAERDLFADRLRLGVGLVRAGLSAYDNALGAGPSSKLFPDEQAYLASQNVAVGDQPRATVSVPVTVRVALSQHWFLLGEAVTPIAGYRTGHGPALAGGFAFDTNTHEFSFIFTNTANAAFNSVITGGAQRMALPLFAFSIAAYL